MANREKEYAQSAARAAFGVLDQLERELSRFIETSDISRIRLLQPGERLRIGIPAMECMEIASHVWALTGGAFDITMAPLVDYWKHHKDAGSPEWEAARASSGFDKLILYPEEFEVAVTSHDLQVDLGAVGKGYGVDQMAELLRNDWEIADFLIEGGESSALAFGSMPGHDGWPVPLRNPLDQDTTLETITLKELSVSGSGIVVHGQHIIDPRTGLPARNTTAAWAIGPRASVTDAISTAMMIMERGEIEEIISLIPDLAGLRQAGGAEAALQRFGAH